MVIIKVAVLRNVPRHPIPRPLQHEQVEDAIVDGGPTLRFFAQVEIAKPLRELRDQRGLRAIVVKPRFNVEKIARAGRFNRARITIIEYRSPIPMS
jgi:hypothetical protein